MQASSSSRRTALDTIIESITDADIKNNINKLKNLNARVDEIKTKAHNNVNKYADFLEMQKTISNGTQSINDFIIDKIYEKEHRNPQQQNYTYWMNGGFSRNFHLQDFRIGHLDIHYAYQDKRRDVIHPKLENIYNDIIIPLQTVLRQKQIPTRIETTHFNVEDNIFKYEKNINVLFRPPFYSIKLIYEKQTGGRKPKNQVQKGGMDIQYIDNLTIVEFHFEFYFEDLYKNFLQNLKKHFIFLSTPPLTGTRRDKKAHLNKLTEAGVIAFSYLYPTNKDTQYGFDIDKDFREAFLKHKYLEQNLLKGEFYKTLLAKYKSIYPEKTKAHNSFFVENIETSMNSYSAPFYEGFIDFVNKWVISMFRPAINAFIKKINEELDAKHHVKLFIAGGDAMRRYSNDISFSKDIDTKLYIANLYQDKTPEEKKIIKQKVIEIITRHIVKLKFYIERNLLKIFDSNNLKYTYDTDKYIAHILQIPKIGSHQLRTREIRNNSIRPVDLYSIDFRIRIIVIDTEKNISKTYNHDISILDVVLQDNKGDDYIAGNLKGDSVPYASLEFLVKDFLYTYYDDEITDVNNPRAMARISSGKYKKDIQRATCIMHHYIKSRAPRHQYQIPKGVCMEIELDFADKEINNMIDFLRDKKSTPTQPIQEFIQIIDEKIRFKKQLNIDNMIKIRTALPIVNSLVNIPHNLQTLIKYLKDFIDLKTNIFYEDIYNIDEAYERYVPQGNYHKNYLQLFQHLCDSDISIENKNKLFYNDRLNDNLIANINDNTPLQTLYSSMKSYNLHRRMSYNFKPTSSIFLSKMHSSRSVIKKQQSTSTKPVIVYPKKRPIVLPITILPPIPEGKKRARASDAPYAKKTRPKTVRGGDDKKTRGQKEGEQQPKIAKETKKSKPTKKKNIKKNPKNVKK
jgi:hypothetical protein